MSEKPARSWSLPDVAGPVVTSRHRSTSARDLSERQAAVQQRVFEEARLRGFEQGQAESDALRESLAATVERLRAAFESAAQPLAQLETSVVDEVCQLALCVGKQLARRELRQDPAQVAAIVRECIALLPSNSRSVRVYLHPGDAAVLRENLQPVSAEGAWQLLEDPVMSRGGCRVETDQAHIDGRFESRVAAIAAAMLDPAEASSGE